MEYKIISAIIIGYLLGSIPFSYIVTRLKMGVDIRKIGGGNAGALNTYREVGPAWGISVLAADIAKGAFAVLIAKWLGIDFAWVWFIIVVSESGAGPCTQVQGELKTRR